MFSKSFWKAVTTLGIWAIMGMISLSAIIFSDGNPNLFTLLIVLTPLLLGLGATLAIWMDSDSDTNNSSETTHDSEKAKRVAGDKYALLLQMMDDDEREAFKYSLKQRLLDAVYEDYDDGELPSASLEDLLMSEKKLRR